MPTEKVSMRKIREVLRLTLASALTQHQVAASTRLTQSTVSKYLALARLANVNWPLPPEMDDLALDRLLFPAAHRTPSTALRSAPPDFAAMHVQLKGKGVKLPRNRTRREKPDTHKIVV